MNLYLIRDWAKKTSSLVLSQTSNQPVEPPDFVAGDSGKDITLYLVDGAGAYDTDSGSVSITPHLSLGTLGALVTGGTFTVSHSTNTTAALAWNITAGALQTALNALASVAAADGVVVTGTAPNFLIVWNTTGTKTDFTGNGNLLTPSGAVVVQNRGDGSVTPKESLLRLMPKSVCETTAWAQSTDTYGWTAQVSTNTLEAFVTLAGAGSVDITLEIALVNSSNDKVTELQVSTRLLASLTTNASALTNSSFPPSPETDPVFGAHVASSITALWISRWNLAWGWGDHALAGYCTIAYADSRYLKLTGGTLSGSLGIYGACDNSAALEIESTTKGFLPPRMTRAQRDAIVNPVAGLVVYQTNEIPGLYHFTGAAWLNLSSAQYCPEDGKYYPIIVQLVGGKAVLGIGDALTT